MRSAGTWQRPAHSVGAVHNMPEVSLWVVRQHLAALMPALGSADAGIPPTKNLQACCAPLPGGVGAGAPPARGAAAAHMPVSWLVTCRWQPCRMHTTISSLTSQ